MKEVLDLETENSMEGMFVATLPARGWEAKDIPAEYLDTSYFYNFKKTGGLKPLARAKVTPKLRKQGIPLTILNDLSSAQLTEMLYIMCRVLYDTGAQPLGMTHYLPGSY